MKEISIQELRDYLKYNPEDGSIIRIKKASSNAKVGDTAGSIKDNGYAAIKLNKKRFLAHRVAWAIYYGEWPSKCLDHINGIRNDNRISNLRECTPMENSWNRRKSKNNTSGISGIYFNKRMKKWCVGIRSNKKHKYLGSFSDFQDAKKIALNARNSFHGEFASI